MPRKEEGTYTREDFEKKMDQIFSVITFKDSDVSCNRMMIKELCKANNIREAEHLFGLLDGKQTWTFIGKGDKIYKILEIILNVDSKGLEEKFNNLDYSVMFPAIKLSDIGIELMRNSVLGHHCEKLVEYGNY